jgi:hypothetical protein
MAKKDAERVIVADHLLEVRHAASGTFLDVRGSLADHIRSKEVFRHWKIGPNVIEFRDAEGALQQEGAFLGYKSLGYTVQDPQTRNFFGDKACAFWKLVLEIPDYKLPQLTRFGTRMKAFVPSSKSFEKINESMYKRLFTLDTRNMIGGQEKDLQLTLELREGEFDVRIAAGPMHKNEAEGHFDFESRYFPKAGLFLDIDFYKTDNLNPESVPGLLLDAVSRMWNRVELIATGIGL